MKYKKEKEIKKTEKQSLKEYFATTKLNYYLHKTISPKNTYLIALIVFALFIIVSYFSYAMFTVYEERQRVLSMQAGSLSATISSKDFNENSKTITVPAKGLYMTSIKVTNTSLTNEKVNLNYIKDDGLEVKYYQNLDQLNADNNGDAIITNGQSKEAVVLLKNTTNEAKNITFGIDFGLSTANLVGTNNVLTEKTNNPFYDAPTSAAYKLVNDSNLIKNYTEEYLPGYYADKETSGMYSFKNNNTSSTFFYRGNVTNNYATFGGKTWRILRILDDGSIKLLAENPIGSGYSNEDSDGKYIYNTGNISLDTAKYNNSLAKQTVNEWYQSEMIANDSKIKEDIYCSDTFYDENNEYNKYQLEKNNRQNFGLLSRAVYGNFDPDSTLSDSEYEELKTEMKILPKLSCKTEDQNQLKAALITGDEFVLAGNGPYSKVKASSYLTKPEIWWSMSPAMIITGTNTYVYEIAATGSLAGAKIIGFSHYLYPVITLIPTVTITDGNGSSGSPYIIQ